MNLPIGKLNRDEVYTFIVGSFSGLAWYLHLQEIGIVTKNSGVIGATLLFVWLFSTGLIHILSSILAAIMNSIAEKRIKVQKDDEELEKMGLIKNLSFFWAGPLEEQRLLLHIYGLVTISLVFVYYPVVFFISTRISLPWVIAIHVAYTLVTIVAYSVTFRINNYLHRVNHFVNKGYCDTLDQTTYVRERAVQYAAVRNLNYLDDLKRYHDEHPTPEANNAPA